MKPNLNDKGSVSEKITLVENNIILTEEKEIENIMNNFFISVTKTLDLRPCKNSNLTDINVIISNFNKHGNFFQIIEHSNLNISSVSLKDVEKILNLNAKNSSAKGSIPATILNHCVDIYLSFFSKFKKLCNLRKCFSV